jgi:hypothetical protein
MLSNWRGDFFDGIKPDYYSCPDPERRFCLDIGFLYPSGGLPNICECCEVVYRRIRMVTNKVPFEDGGGPAFVGFTSRKVPIFHQHHDLTLLLDTKHGKKETYVH